MFVVFSFQIFFFQEQWAATLLHPLWYCNCAMKQNGMMKLVRIPPSFIFETQKAEKTGHLFPVISAWNVIILRGVGRSERHELHKSQLKSQICREKSGKTVPVSFTFLYSKMGGIYLKSCLKYFIAQGATWCECYITKFSVWQCWQKWFPSFIVSPVFTVQFTHSILFI